METKFAKTIFVRPLDGTAVASGYTAHGSLPCKGFAGSGDGWFTFPAGNHHASGTLADFADPGIGVLDRLCHRVEHKLDNNQP